MTRDVERDRRALARLDVEMRCYGSLAACPEELQDELDQLSMERCRALNAQSIEPVTVAPRGAA